MSVNVSVLCQRAESPCLPRCRTQTHKESKLPKWHQNAHEVHQETAWDELLVTSCPCISDTTKTKERKYPNLMGSTGMVWLWELQTHAHWDAEATWDCFETRACATQAGGQARHASIAVNLALRLYSLKTWRFRTCPHLAVWCFIHSTYKKKTTQSNFCRNIRTFSCV